MVMVRRSLRPLTLRPGWAFVALIVAVAWIGWRAPRPAPHVEVRSGAVVQPSFTAWMQRRTPANPLPLRD